MANTERPGVILNDDALRERYVPLDLTARESHVTRIRACLDSVSKGRKPTHLWLYGPSGSGKTCLARAILAKLSQESAVRSVAVTLRGQYMVFALTCGRDAKKWYTVPRYPAYKRQKRIAM